MKSLKRAGLLLAFCAVSASAWSATTNFTTRSGAGAPEPVVIDEPRREFPAGEKLVYDVSWMGIPVGVGEVEVVEKRLQDGRTVYHVKARAKTNEVLSTLYPVDDQVESVFDASDFRSLYFRKKLSEGRYRADEESHFGIAPGRARYKSRLNGTEKEFAARDGAHDIVSAFYAFRTRMARPGESLHLPVSSEEKDWDVEVRVLATEKKEMKGRVVDTILIEPKSRLKGVLYRRGRVWIHLTADARRVPVLIQLKTPFGPVVGVLRDFDTL